MNYELSIFQLGHDLRDYQCQTLGMISQGINAKHYERSRKLVR